MSSLAMAAVLAAQQGAPQVGYVYPAGGQQGASFEVTVGGQFLDGVSSVYVSGAGIDASVIGHTKPLTAAQASKLRDQLKELLGKRPAAPEDARTIAEIREKLAAFVRRPSSPAIAETVRVRVTVAPGVAPGERELRLGTPRGLTNPLLFCIGQLPEFSKPPAKVAGQPVARPPNQPRSNAPEPPASITLPAVLNGQIAPGSVDRYPFRAGKGQHLVAAVSARRLMPYVSDAVPGWFQAVLTLYDPRGREVAYADDFRFNPDPVLHYQIPEDGEYVLAIRDSIYRGREDFVYRLTVGELPFLASIFPLGGKAGSKTTVELRGWNLPAASVRQDLKNKNQGVHSLAVRKGEWISNQAPFAVDTLPERLEREPNNDPKRAQAVKLPLMINGRIDSPGDLDVVRFEGRAGQEIVAEVLARRLDSPLDSVLMLTDAAGRRLAANDDTEDQGAGLLTHHADSRIRFTLPAKGTYYVHLGDTQNKGGPEYTYRLRLSLPQPDFELRVAPSSVNVRGGTSATVTAYALRRDGFAGDIALRLKDPPRGFALSGGWIPAGQDKVRLTIAAPATRMDEPVSLRLEGHARIQGREVSRPGVPAEDMMQAFAYHHLVASQDWLVRVTPPGRVRIPWRLPADEPVKLPSGATAPVRLLGPRGALPKLVHFELNQPPEGISIQEVTPAPDGLLILLRTDAGKVKPGLKGNLIVEAFTEPSATPAGGQQRAAGRRILLAALPAIPFEVTGNVAPRP